MESLALLIGVTLVAVITAVSYLFGRQSAGPAPANATTLEPETAAEIARLQERERTLTADIARQAGEIQRFSEALLISQREHATSRERLAAAEERAAGLAKALASEKESDDAVQRTLLAELDAAVATRDRLHTSLNQVSQKLAVAEERASGLQRNATVEREGSDSARRSLSVELDQMTEARDRFQTALADTSQRLAAAEERAAGLQSTLSAERASHENARRMLSAELDTVTQARDRLQVTLAETAQRLAAAAQMEHELRERIGRAESEVADRDQRTAAYEEKLEVLRLQLDVKERDLAASLEREFSLVRDLAERDKTQLEDLRERLAGEFETIANRLLASSASQQLARSPEAPAAVIDPLSARIIDFQQKVQTARLEARQSETARVIAEQAGELYDALVAAVADLNDVSFKLREVAEAYGDAMNKLSTGEGNPISRAELLRSLGAGSRVIPLISAVASEDARATAVQP